MSLRVAFIGLGAMGLPMAEQLARIGLLSTVFDARAEATAAMCEQHVGVRAAASPADAADGVDVVITMLPTSAVVERVALGNAGIAQARRAPRFLIDMSSGEPVATRAIAEGLALHGLRMLDAPVSGGVTRAQQGTLAVMVGGAAQDVAAVRGVLANFGTLTHVGPLGAGQALKALNNMASATGLLIAAEVLSVARRFGLSPDVVVDVLNASSGMNNATQSKLRQYVLSQSYASGFGMDLMVKDLGIAAGIAASLGAHAPLFEASLRQWREAAQQLGPGRDHTEIARVSARLAGLAGS